MFLYAIITNFFSSLAGNGTKKRRQPQLAEKFKLSDLSPFPNGRNGLADTHASAGGGGGAVDGETAPHKVSAICLLYDIYLCLRVCACARMFVWVCLWVSCFCATETAAHKVCALCSYHLHTLPLPLAPLLPLPLCSERSKCIFSYLCLREEHMLLGHSVLFSSS